MGSYSYKDLCHSIPEKYTENFEKKYGREFDCDANYNGDYWVIAADYVDDLEQDLAHMKSIVRRCKEVMECNDPTNYKLIFGTT
jgi:hypothetical protein